MQKKIMGHSLCRFLGLQCLLAGALFSSSLAQNVKATNPAPPAASAAAGGLRSVSAAPSAPSVPQKQSRVLPSHLQRVFTSLRASQQAAASGKLRQPRSGRDDASARPMADSAPSPNFGGFTGSVAAFPIAQPVYDFYYDTVYDPISPVTGDFNGDGIPDLALSQTDGSIDVLLGDGKGGFSAPVVTPTSLSGDFSYAYVFPNMIAVDLNGDGKQDLITWDRYGEVAIILNNGDATFGTPSYLNLYAASGYTQYEVAVSVADVNGDGHPDLIGAVCDSSGALVVNAILNPGDGTFSASSKLIATSQALPAGTTAWVFNDTGTIATINGKLTLAFAAEEYATTGGPPYSGYVFLAASNGDGTFTFNPSPINIPSVTGTNTPLVVNQLPGKKPWPEHALRVQDLNNDGSPDILIALGDGYLYSAIGLGGGSFAPPVLAVPYFGFQLPDLQLYDYDGDGWADLLDSENEYTAAFHGNGDGTFTLASATMTGEAYTYAQGYEGAAPGGRLTAYGDFNGDGRPDVVSIDNAYGVAVLSTNQAGLTFTGAPRLADTGAVDQTPSFPYGLLAQAAADMNGDGKTDIVGFNEAGPELLAVVGINQGAGVFKWTSAPTLLNVPLAVLGFSSVTGDFNHDGKPDVIIYGYDSGFLWHVYTALSNGDGTFQQPVEIVLPNEASTGLLGEIDQFAVGDLNGDGNIDITALYESPYNEGVLGYYVALGDGTGQFPKVTFTPTGTDVTQLALADFNGDGALDLALGSTPDGTNPSLEVLLNDGKGNFGTLPPSVISSTEVPIVLSAADINQDGKIDLVMSTEGYYSPDSGQDFTESGIAIYPGNGDGTFGQRSLISEQGVAADITVADFNGDGLPDILSGLVEELDYTVLPSTTQPFYGISLLLNSGKGAFAAPINTFTAGGVGLLAAGNFYGVGGTDLLVADTSGASIFYNQGTSTLALSASNASVSQGDTVTLTAAVAAGMPSRPVPTGVVTFYNGGTAIGSTVLDGSRVTTLTTSFMTAGSNAITATYAGDTNFNPAMQAAPVSITVNALPPAFSLSSSSSYATLGAAGATPLTLTLTPNATFAGTVALAATGVPTGVTVQFNPATVPLGGVESAQAIMTITTGQSSTASLKEKGPAWMIGTGAGISMAGMLLVFLPGRRRRHFGMLVLALAALTAFTALSGCGGGGGSQGPKSGTVQITITATPSSSGVPPQSTTVNLTIQ